MPNTTDYTEYCDRQRAYGWRPLDYVTWLSWHLNVSRATMNIKGKKFNTIVGLTQTPPIKVVVAYETVVDKPT